MAKGATATFTAKDKSKRREPTPFDEARAAWRKIDKLQKQIAEVKAGLSANALALLETVADLEKTKADDV